CFVLGQFGVVRADGVRNRCVLVISFFFGFWAGFCVYGHDRHRGRQECGTHGRGQEPAPFVALGRPILGHLILLGRCPVWGPSDAAGRGAGRPSRCDRLGVGASAGAAGAETGLLRALRTLLCFRPGRDGFPGPWGEQGFTRSVTVFSGVRPEERLLLFGSAPMDGSRKLTPLVCPGNGGNERKVGTHSCPCSAPGWVTHARTQNGAPRKWRKAPRHSDGQILLRGGQA